MNIKTKRMICLLVGIASVLTIIGTVSYAYFTAISEINTQTATLSTGTARVTFRDGDTGITGELSFGESITKKFTIENTGTVDANVKMYFKDLINTYGVGSLTYTLLQAETEGGTYTEVVNKTDVPRSSRPSKKRLVDQLTIPVGKTYYYELVITLNYLPDVNQDADMNARFSSSFEIEDINEPEAPLPELMAVTSSYNEKLWAHRDTVKRIVFETTETPRENAAYTYDLSSAQDGSIMSYLYPDVEDSTKYIAYIQSEEGIKANSNSSYLFYNFTNLEQINNLYYLDTSSVTNMASMFSVCKQLISLDLSNFDTSNVTNMNSMFYSCTNLTTLSISNFNTSNVTRMDSIFKSCKLLTSLDVSNFDTSKVTNMAYMFAYCSSLTSLDLSNFDTSSVTSMSYMFSNCSEISSIEVSSFDTGSVINMSSMFGYCNNLSLLDISRFDTSKVTNMSGMFSACKALTTLNVSTFNTSNVTNMSRMFSSSGLITLNVSNFDTSNVTNMAYMFSDCKNLISLDLSSFDTSKVTLMTNVFRDNSKLESLNIKNWDVSKVGKWCEAYSCTFTGVPSTIKIRVSNSTMRQQVIDISDTPKLTTSNVII